MSLNIVLEDEFYRKSSPLRVSIFRALPSTPIVQQHFRISKDLVNQLGCGIRIVTIDDVDRFHHTFDAAQNFILRAFTRTIVRRLCRARSTVDAASRLCHRRVG